MATPSDPRDCPACGTRRPLWLPYVEVDHLRDPVTEATVQAARDGMQLR